MVTITNEDLVQAFQDGDQAAMETLLLKSKGLVWHCVRRYRGRRAGCDNDDLFQIGWIALWRAAQRFDRQRGVKFTTYAVSTIWHAIYDFGQTQQLLWIGSRVVLNQSERTRRLKAQSRRIVWLDAFNRQQRDLFDLPERPANEAARQADAARERVGQLLGLLDGRDESIVHDRAEGQTLKEIGQKLGICRERVRQLEGLAFEKLRREAAIS